MDRKILRLLFVDDSPDEVETLVIALRDSFLLKWQRVQDMAALEGVLARGECDVLLSELRLPQLGATAVLDVIRRMQLDVPVLVLTRTVEDGELHKIMRAGARDVLLKQHTMRLLPAIERELAAAQQRTEHRRAIERLKEIEHKHDAYIDGAREAISYCQDGMHLNANQAYLEMFEYDNLADIEGVPLMNLIDKGDHQRFRDYVRQTRKQKGALQEFSARRKSGANFPVEVTLAPVTINGEAFTQVLVSDISRRRAVENKLKYLNEHDPLTGLYNRHYFLQALTRAITRARADGTGTGLVYLDFQDLRRINNALGHTAADRFLLAAARSLRDVFGGDAVVARCADHEFAALVTGAPTSSLRELAARAEQAFNATPFHERGVTIKYACRLATVAIDRGTESVQAVMAALYQVIERTTPARPAPVAASKQPAATPPPVPIAKTPASRTAPAEEKSAPAVEKVVPMPRDPQDRLQWAIDQQAFQLNYQPIISLHGDPAEYFEVLVRMIGDNGQVVPAAEFMPLAERSGRGNAIDRWVIRQAIRSLADLHRQDRRATFFINLSATALHDVEMVVMIQRWLNESAVHGRHVILEMDESSVIAHPDAASAFMRAAKLIGCELCLDNFGHRFGAIAQLSQLPIDYFKLDGALVRSLADETASRGSLKAAVDAAKTTGRKTVAKSVESAEAISVLWALGIDYAQGNYFQQADASLDYEFARETTLSSESHSPNWAAGDRR